MKKKEEKTMKLNMLRNQQSTRLFLFLCFKHLFEFLLGHYFW